MGAILGIGNAVTDVICTLPDNFITGVLNLPLGGMTHIDMERGAEIAALVDGKEMVSVPGGSSANTVALTSYLGMKSGFIGKVGSDAMGDAYLESLEKNGVAVHLLRGKLPSARSMAFVSEGTGERSFATCLGAALELAPSEILPQMFEGYDYLLVEGYLLQSRGVVEKAMEIARGKGMTISFDLGSCSMIERNRPLMERLVGEFADVVFANEEEAYAFTGKGGEEAAKDLSGREGGRTAVVKLGEKGSVLCREGEICRIDAQPAVVVDTIGAGDAYAAGFLYAHSLGAPLMACGISGSIVAAEAVGSVGPKISKNRLEKMKKDLFSLLKNKD